MAILYSYPLGTPLRTDLLVGSKIASSDTDDLPITENYNIGSILDMISTTSGAQTFYQVANVGAGVVGGNETIHTITFKDIYVKGTFKDKDGDVGGSGQILSSTVAGTEWIDNNSGVTSIIAGTNVTISPGSGLGDVTVNSTVPFTSLTTTGTSGAATLLSGILNVPTPTGDNFYLTGLAFDTATGIATATVTGAANVTVDLDGRYMSSLTTTGTTGAATFSGATGILNVPNYADTDVGITTAVVKASTVSTGYGITEVINVRELELYPHYYDGGTDVGFVPTGGTGTTYLKGDGTWGAIPTGLVFKDVWDASGGGGGSPDLTAVTPAEGWLYICDAAGTAYPNGGSTPPSAWSLGDWCIYNGTAWTRVPATNAGVTSFLADSSSSTYLTMTPTVATTGAVELDADLNAVDGTCTVTTRYLSKDNTWDIPCYTTDTNTTYSIASGETTVISLTAADPAGAAGTVTLAASGAASVSGTGNTITIGATNDNTTYDYLAIETIPTFTLNATTNTGYTAGVNQPTTVSPAGGTGMTVNTTVVGGNVTAVVINNPGSGYDIGDYVTITGGSGDAIITLSGTVGNVNPNLRLIDQAFGFDDVKLTGGTNVTITRTSDTGVTFTSVNT